MFVDYGKENLLMKKFKYVWKLNGKELNGSKDAENETTLSEHIKKVGGELIKIESMEDLPEKLILPKDAAAVAANENLYSGGGSKADEIKTGRWRRLVDFQEDLPVLNVWAWLFMGVSILVAIVILIAGILSLFGVNVDVTYAGEVVRSGWVKFGVFCAGLFLTSVIFLSGFIAVSWPGIGLIMMVLFSFPSCVPSLLALGSGNILGGIIGVVLNGFLTGYGIYHLKKI